MRHSARHRQGGVALAILVWFLAAMSLLVAGIVMQARVDIKLAQSHSKRAKIEAAADGAIQLALADLMLTDLEVEFEEPAEDEETYSVGDMEIAVSFTPLTGLIDINMASEDLLFLLLSKVEDLDETAAAELSLSVVEWRSATAAVEDPYGSDSQAVSTRESTEQSVDEVEGEGLPRGRFAVIEDLLLIPGFDRRIYEAVRDAVYVNEEGQAGVDWMSAPASVLRVIGDLDEATANELVAARESGEMDGVGAPEEIDLDFQEAADILALRVDAQVKSDDVTYLRRRWVNRAKAGADGLPWSFFRNEAVTVLSQTSSDALATEGKGHAGD